MSAPDPPANIAGAVDSVAVQYGVPSGIWKDLAYTESGYNAQSINYEADGSISYGLFQLNNRGQGYGHTYEELTDPATNARIAMPAISHAWNDLKGSFNSGDSGWWQRFAAESGHPGGTPGQQVTDNEATLLQSNYPGDSGNNDFWSIASGAATGATGMAINDSIAAINAAIQNAFSSIIAPIPGLLIQIALFIVALALLGIGLYVVVTNE